MRRSEKAKMFERMTELERVNFQIDEARDIEDLWKKRKLAKIQERAGIIGGN